MSIKEVTAAHDRDSIALTGFEPARKPRFRASRSPLVVWFLDTTADDATSSPPPGIPPQSRIATLKTILEQAGTGDLVLLRAASIRALVQHSEELLGKGLTVAIDCGAAPALRPFARSKFGGQWVILSPLARGRFSQAFSRAADTFIGALALVALSPIMVALTVAIRLSSPGPALFRTTMVGQEGRVFELFKLKSMRAPSRSDEDAVRKERYRDFMAIVSDGDPNVVKVVNESRITPLGRLLRKHSLDELPQFWNVMRGDIALVGARPCLPYEYELYEPWHRLRFRGKPGVTGFWQAYGRGRVTFEQMVLMDYCYSWLKSPLLDLKILAQTARVVVTGEGGR